MKDDRVYLRHILECVRRIEENTALIRSSSRATASQLSMFMAPLILIRFRPSIYRNFGMVQKHAEKGNKGIMLA